MADTLDKKHILLDLLNCLRIAINQAAFYPEDHPTLKQSLKVLQANLENMFSFVNPFKLSVAPQALLIEGEYLEKEAFHKRFALMLHQKKIKSIELRAGITTEELINFIIAVSMTPQDIDKRGGILSVLSLSLNPHILIEELDYSVLLKDKGESVADVWAYLLKEAVSSYNVGELDELVNNFDKVVSKFNIRDILSESKLQKNLHNFLNYLQNIDTAKFRRCSKVLIKVILKNKSLPTSENIGRLKNIFEGVSEEDLVDVLWGEIVTEDKWDPLTLKFFSQFIDEGKQENIASALAERISTDETLFKNSSIQRKIKGLFTIEGGVSSGSYRYTLLKLLEDISAGEGIRFDRNLLRSNYRYVLLNILAIENMEKRVNTILDAILKEWDEIIETKDFEYLASILALVNKRREENPHLSVVFDGLSRRISEFVEDLVFDEDIAYDISAFVGSLTESAFGYEFYLKKFFEERKMAHNSLFLFLNIFPGKINDFCARLEKVIHDVAFIEEVLAYLMDVNLDSSLIILKYIYSVSNTFVKVEVIKAMGNLSCIDKGFLFSVVRKSNPFVKKEALKIISRYKPESETAAKLLLGINNFLGFRNRIILTHLRIIQDIKLAQAEPFINSLARCRFFWNKPIRDKAKEIIEGWNA
ncbi:MAG: hypothetical protein ABH872_01540 [Candidatus Omnitrophota bacterium]